MITVYATVDVSKASCKKEMMQMIRNNDNLYKSYFNRVLSQAYQLCPIRTGVMARSMYQLSKMTYDKGKKHLSIHFEAYAVSKYNDFNYAYLQHEDPKDKFTHAAGKSKKFLEIPFVLNTQKLLTKLHGVVKSVWQ